MRHFAITIAAIAALTATSAAAADMAVKAPPPPIVGAQPNWTGFYIGGNAGYAWGHTSWFEDPSLSGSSGIGPAGFQDASYDTSGALGGGQVGYNYQAGRVVWGIQADFEGADITGNGGCFPEVVGTSQNCSTKIKSLGTVSGRVGWAFDQGSYNSGLLYVLGGWAWIHEDHANFCNTCVGGGPAVGNASDTRGGWTVGVGYEFALMGAWSAFVQYNYMGFGTRDLTFVITPAAAPFTENVRPNLSVFKAGINYRFGWPLGATRS